MLASSIVTAVNKFLVSFICFFSFCRFIQLSCCTATWELLHNKCQVLLRVHQIDTIEWKNMKTVAHDCGIEEKDIMQALEFLKDVGSLVYYITDTKKHHPDFVIIDPSWLANVMSSVITFRHSWVRDGILLHSDFPHVWESYSTAMYENLIQLLEKFEISYRMAGNPPRSLIPSLLNPRQPSDTLASIWPTECPTEFDQFMRKFKFKFLPMGLFERLLVRVLHIPNTQSSLIWKTGTFYSFPFIFPFLILSLLSCA